MPSELIFDLGFELARLIIVILLWLLFLWSVSKSAMIPGAQFISWGFALLAFGSAIDITDNFAVLNQYVVVGDTPVQAFLEKVCGYIGGYLLLFIGFCRWLPDVINANCINEQLKTEVRKRRASELKLTKNNVELVAARDALQSSYDLQKQFVANISHDLRTPMHSIEAYAELGLELEGLGDKGRGYYKRIVGSARRLRHLVDNILELSRLESGQATLDLACVDLGDLVQGVLVENQARLAQLKIDWNFTVVTAKPEVMVDRDAMAQVITNLIGNVIDHAQEGQKLRLELIDSTLDCEASGGDKKAIALTCRDWGPGIPEAALSRIFDKFVQVEKKSVGRKGSGLGLAICKELIELHGGDIRATNHQDGGAEFVVSIPRPG